MTDTASTPPDKATKASSFGSVAGHYERFRPGPPTAAVDWLLPAHVGRVVDLGAGTGALTRLLIGRADEVVAVEPDDRMREVLAAQVPGARALKGTGEAMPLEDGSVDTVLASSSWHWMDPIPAVTEMARIVVPGGILGTLWTGPDPDGDFMQQANALMAPDTMATIRGDGNVPGPVLEIPPGLPFDEPEHKVFGWDIALTADDLIGLLGTLSWIILMPEEESTRLKAEARRLLSEFLGVKDDVTVDVRYKCEAFKARRQG